MVSIHDTHEFHNYINSPPPPPEFEISPNTILDYLQKNHPIQYSLIENSKLITRTLNNTQLKYTLFLPMDTEEIDFERHLYRGMLDMSTDFQISSINGNIIQKSKNLVNNRQILVNGINLVNGTIHIAYDSGTSHQFLAMEVSA